MNLQKIIQKQEEIISMLKCYCSYLKNDDDLIDRLESEIASLKAQEESNELTDLKQYVTNLLYYAHVEAMSMHSIDFDKWVEDHINNLNQYFAQSHQVEMPSDVAKTETDTGKLIDMPDITCDVCGRHPAVIVQTQFGRYCMEHAKYV